MSSDVGDPTVGARFGAMVAGAGSYKVGDGFNSANSQAMRRGTLTTTTTDLPLNVAVRAELVIIHLPDGTELRMTVADAQRSLQRLSDALALAKGHHPALSRD